jgi:hypothetical protein
MIRPLFFRVVAQLGSGRRRVRKLALRIAAPRKKQTGKAHGNTVGRAGAH